MLMALSSCLRRDAGEPRSVRNQQVVDQFELGAPQTIKAIFEKDIATLAPLRHADAPARSDPRRHVRRRRRSSSLRPAACAWQRSFAAISSGTLTVIATLADTIGTGRLMAWASCTYREACRRDRSNASVSMSVACGTAQPWASRSNAAFKRWALSAPVDRDICHKHITVYAESQASTLSGTAQHVARTRSYLLRLWRDHCPLRRPRFTQAPHPFIQDARLEPLAHKTEDALVTDPMLQNQLDQEAPNVGIEYAVHRGTADRHRQCIKHIVLASSGSEPV